MKNILDYRTMIINNISCAYLDVFTDLMNLQCGVAVGVEINLFSRICIFYFHFDEIHTMQYVVSCEDFKRKESYISHCSTIFNEVKRLYQEKLNSKIEMPNFE